jgi:signal transduction histidine kinase
LADVDLCCVDRGTIIVFIGQGPMDAWLLCRTNNLTHNVTGCTDIIAPGNNSIIRLLRPFSWVAGTERNNKLLNAQAITAAIAHEVRQPLTAIIASGGAALEYLRKTPPEIEKARSAVSKMVKEGHRTGDVFDGIHALFKRGDQKRERIDLNEIVISVLDSLRVELMDHGIAALPRIG